MMTRAAPAFFALFIFFAQAQASPLAEVNPSRVPVGGVAVVRVTAGFPVEHASASWSGGEVALFEEEGKLVGLLGVDLDVRPGEKELRVKAVGKRGGGFVVGAAFRVEHRDYPVQRLTVAQEMVTPRPEVQKRIAREYNLLQSIFKRATPARYFNGRFKRPVPGEKTSPFGARRILNGNPRSPHSGVDLRAALGEEVRATNSGVVVLAEKLYLPGNSVVVDHGGGLHSVYYHLSEVMVEEGLRVEKGEIIGLAGKSGRVTGAHLHFGFNLSGARVDPELVLGLDPM